MEVAAWTESSSIICDFVFFGAAGVCYCSPLIFLTKVVWSGVRRWRLPASLEKAGEIRSRSSSSTIEASMPHRSAAVRAA
jgi:hypothetical protein